MTSAYIYQRQRFNKHLDQERNEGSHAARSRRRWCPIDFRFTKLDVSSADDVLLVGTDTELQLIASRWAITEKNILTESLIHPSMGVEVRQSSGTSGYIQQEEIWLRNEGGDVFGWACKAVYRYANGYKTYVSGLDSIVDLCTIKRIRYKCE